MKLADLITAVAGLDLKRTGSEWHSACPWCGGQDRFTVTTKDHYFCRGCERKGDAIQFLRDFKGLGFRAACEYLGQEWRLKDNAPVVKLADQQEWKPKAAGIPARCWQDQAGAVLSGCIDRLWSADGQAVVEWLRSRRGFTEATIRSNFLGLNDNDIYAQRSDWGLPEELNAQGKPKKIWIPAGVVIPTFCGADLVRLRVRRGKAASDGQQKYIFVSGGDYHPMLLDNGRRIWLVVESELDGLLVNQVAADLVNVLAIGALSIRPDRAADRQLRYSRMILVALDTGDKNLAGCRQAHTWWPATYRQAVRCPVIGGKDPAEAWQHGTDLRLWIEAAIDGGATPMRRPA